MIQFKFTSNKLVVQGHELDLNKAKAMVCRTFPHLVLSNKIGSSVKKEKITINIDWNYVFRLRVIANFLINKAKNHGSKK